MIRIMIVDDQRLIRNCFRIRLNAVEDFEVVAEAASGEEARQLARKQPLDIILMDLNMPGIGGLEAARRLLASRPRARIIGLSQYVDGPYPSKFMEIGGAGYVSKNADVSELITAVRRVHDGQCYISNDVAQHIAARDLLPNSGVDASDLSERELQVLHQISEGRSIEQIAALLCLSPKTISHHRRRLLKRFDVINDVQLSLIARENGLTDLGSLLNIDRDT